MLKALVRGQIVIYLLVNGFAFSQTVKTPQRPTPAKSTAVAMPKNPASRPRYLQGPFDSQESTLGPNFMGHDPEAIVAVIRDSDASKPKSEFETTAQYQTRQTTKSLAGHRYVFVIDPGIGFFSLGGVNFAYDADKQVMTAQLRVHKQELRGELNYALITKHEEPITSKAIGTNAFGASVEITEYWSREHGIALMHLPPDLLHETLPGGMPDSAALASQLSKFFIAEADVTVPMTPNRAERLKPDLRLAVVGVLSDMRFLTGFEEKKPTLSDPTGVNSFAHFIPIIPEQLLLFDFKTGEILKRVDGTTTELSPSLPGSPSVSSLISGTDIPLTPIEKPSPPSPPKAPTPPSQSTLPQSPVSLPPSQIPTSEIRVVSKCCFDLMATQGHLRIASPARARIQGTVRLKVVIGKNGVIQNLQLVSGHPMLVQSAIDAVKQWVYKPTLLNSEPVEVTRDVSVDFTLSQ